MKSVNPHFCLISLLICFVISNIIGIPITQLNFLPYPFETSIIEILQTIILLSTLSIYIKSKNIFIKASSNLMYYFKLAVIVFLIYEENSFFTKGFSSFFNTINGQGEINLHNLQVLDKNNIFSNIHLYGLDSSFSLTYSGFLILFFLGIIGFGSFVSKSNNIRFFAFDRKFSFYSLFCLVELSISFMCSKLMGFKVDLISWEQAELFTYYAIFLDIQYKSRKYRTQRYFK